MDLEKFVDLENEPRQDIAKGGSVGEVDAEVPMTVPDDLVDGEKSEYVEGSIGEGGNEEHKPGPEAARACSLSAGGHDKESEGCGGDPLQSLPDAEYLVGEGDVKQEKLEQVQRDAQKDDADRLQHQQDRAGAKHFSFSSSQKGNDQQQKHEGKESGVEALKSGGQEPGKVPHKNVPIGAGQVFDAVADPQKGVVSVIQKGHKAPEGGSQEQKGADDGKEIDLSLLFLLFHDGLLC
jgi:hypothetical protein